MKPLIAGIVTLVLVSATADAQIDRYKIPPESGNKQEQAESVPGDGDSLARMKANLGLSDEQVAQILEIRQRGGSRKEVRAVFTDEQRALIQERRRKAQSRKGKGEPGRYYSLPPEGQDEEPDGS